MNMLVLGAGGLLGSNVVYEGQRRDHDVAGTFYSTRPALDVPLDQLDIRDTDDFRALLERTRPDVVVNCAALTDVDRCEADPETAFAVNARAPGTLAAACHKRRATFVHISTDYVFDGTADTPYPEDAETRPLQMYGVSKCDGEVAVQDSASEALITRLSFVWGFHRGTAELTGFPAWVRERLTAGEPTPLFTDQHVTPTRAGAAAATLLDLVDARRSGLFHVAARSCVTPYQFGAQLCEHLDAAAELLETGSRADVDRPAPRPRYTCLDVSRVTDALSRQQPTLAADLDAVAALL